MTEAEREQMERSLSKKAKLYDDLQKGYIEDSAGLYSVDFDRKYTEAVERGEDPLDSEDDEGDDGKEEVKYIDEFGRTIKMSKKQYQRQIKLDEERAKFREEHSARPSRPDRVIRGDFIQVNSFEADDFLNERLDRVREENERLAHEQATKGRYFDRDEHGRRRTYGASYVRLSHDEEERKQQLDALAEVHAETMEARAKLQSKQSDEESNMHQANQATERAGQDPFASLEIRTQGEDDEGDDEGRDSPDEQGNRAATRAQDPLAQLETTVKARQAEVERRTDDFLKDLEAQLYGE
jgi:hypothetical protein